MAEVKYRIDYKDRDGKSDHLGLLSLTKEDAEKRAKDYIKVRGKDFKGVPFVVKCDIVEFSEEVVDTIKSEDVEFDESIITEAPDDDGIMTDDELDNLDKAERDEFEARLKARRDKVAQQRADRDAQIARDNELKAKAEVKLKEIGDNWDFENLFDVLVPNSGKCDTLAGELVRAANRIEYRWFNDGDKFNEDYGIETCGQPAYFLANFEYDDKTPFWDIILNVDTMGMDDRYEKFIDTLKDAVVNYIYDHQELLAMDTKDMFDTSVREVANWLDDYNLIPRYDLDASIPDELQAHLDAGNVDERDIIWEVQSWIENMGNSTDDVTIDWGNVYITGLDYSDYNELEGNLYNWLEQYAHELDDEYGDPNDTEDDPDEWSGKIADELDVDENRILNILANHSFDSYNDARDYIAELIDEENEEESEEEDSQE